MIKINENSYRELRCTYCRKLICYEYIFAGRIAYICSRCGQTNEFTFKHLQTTDNIASINKDFIVKGGE